jgi:hypothetical protein
VPLITWSGILKKRVHGGRFGLLWRRIVRNASSTRPDEQAGFRAIANSLILAGEGVAVDPMVFF